MNDKKTINLNEFSGENDMIRLSRAADFLRSNPGTELVIPEGTYDITTELSRQIQQNVMNGIYGENPEKTMFCPEFEYSVGFDLSDISNCTVLAYGALFMVDGFMEPVSVRECDGITIKGLSIDHKRKPFSCGKVISVVISDEVNPESYLDVVFSDDFPLNEFSPMPRICMYDTYAAHFVDYNDMTILGHEFISPQHIRIYARNVKKQYVGMELYLWHTFHSRPAILLYNSSNITLENVTIHSQPGMGIVAHHCENLSFNALRVVPSVGVHMSTNTDATHIVSCKGTLKYENCQFEGQGDDALNVHTYYYSIEKTGDCSALLRLDAPTGTHSQLPDIPDRNDILELTARGSLAAKDVYRVISVQWIEETRKCAITLDKVLPENCNAYLFSNATRQPLLTYRNNYSHSHLARGVLVKTKKALIENNTFLDVVGTAIHIAAEESWLEACCTTESVIIRNNRILFCGRNDDIRERRCAGICVTVTSDSPTEQTHENVEIVGNIVECPDSPRAIYVSNTKNLIIRNNNVLCASDDGIVIEQTAKVK